MRGLETSGGARVRSFAVGEKKRGGPPRVRERRSSTLPVRVRSDAGVGVGVGVGAASSAPSTVGSSSGATEAASVIAATTSAFIAGVAPSATPSSFSAAASASLAAELPSLDATRVRRDDDTRRLFVVPKDAAASTTTTRVAGRAGLRPVPTRVLATTAVARAGHAIAALVIVFVFVFPPPPRCAQGSADASISDSRATCRSQPRVWISTDREFDREQCLENLGGGRFAAPLARLASHASHSFDAYRALEDVRWASRGLGSPRTRRGMPDADSHLGTRCRILRSPGFSRSFSCSSRSSPRPLRRTQTFRVDAAL